MRALPRARDNGNNIHEECQAMREKMSRSRSRSVYRKGHDRLHKRNLVAGVSQRGGYRL